MPETCKNPRVSIDHDSGRMYVWLDENGDPVGLMLQPDGSWMKDIPLPDDLKDNFSPVRDVETAIYWARKALEYRERFKPKRAF